MTGQALEALGSLAIVLGVLVLLRAGLRWTGFDKSPGAKRLRVLETCGLGGRKHLHLLDADGAQLVVAVSDDRISLLHVVREPAPAPAEAVEGLEAGEDRADATALEAPAPAPVHPTGLRALHGALTRHAPTRRGVAGALLAAALLGTVAGPAEIAFAESAAPESARTSAPTHTISLGDPEEPGGLAPALEMLAVLTLVSIAPSILLMATCFTRIVIVLAFLRQAIGIQHLPPNQVLVGLALFLTAFVMAPVAEQIRVDAYEPYAAGNIDGREAAELGVAPVRGFLLEYTREADLALFVEIAGSEPVASIDDVSLSTLLPAYVISELRTAFEIGFMIFLPFLVIDLVIASMLISMGMIVLPPIVISLPFKLMLFVLVDGWNLILGSLVSGLR